MFSRHTAAGVLQAITGYQAFPAVTTAYVALFTTAPTDDSGTGAVEVTGGAYARVATTNGTSGTWAAASTSTDPTTIANGGSSNAVITFPTATASWGTVVAMGLYDAASGGNLLTWDWLGNFPWQPCTISAASPAVVTVGQAGYANTTSVVLDTANRFGGVSPTYTAGAPTANTVMTTLGLSGDTFTLENGATATNCSVAGSSMIRQVTQQSVPSGVQPSFASGTLILSAA